MFLATIEAVRSVVSASKIEAILSGSNLEEIMRRVRELLGDGFLRRGLSEAEAVLDSVAIGAGLETVQLLGELFQVGGVDLEALAARSVLSVRDQLLGEIHNAEAANFEAIRETLVEMFGEGGSQARAARQIRDCLGLDSRRAGALRKFEASLRAAGGRSEAEILRMVEAERLVKLQSRAWAWSRTETLRAATRGQLDTWQQASAQGLMRGNFSTLFKGAAGDLFGPPAHPNCLCAVMLELGEDGLYRRRWIRVPLPQECPICSTYDGQLV